MLSRLSEWLFDSSGLTPHGFCLLWEPGLIWTYAVSDTVIALAYFSIPLALVVVARRRQDLVFRPLLWLFAAFILLCGTTHWLDLATLWAPLYGLQGLVKAATAIVSIGAAVALWRFLPNFLALPSPSEFRETSAALTASREQLFQAQKMEAVGQLTGGIAHDFNNLIQVITSSLAMMERRIATGAVNDIGRFIAAIRQASDTAARLTNRLLAFSRRQTLQPRVIEPDKLVAGMEEMLRRTLGPEIRLDLQLGADKLDAFCDPNQLESALLNLCINARDAMPDGGALRIATAERRLGAEELANPDAQPGDYIEIAVTDTGAGMSEEVMDRAFEPFYTTKPMGQGTGLGLSQVYGFVRQSGGAVRLESSPGKGATVRLYLPGRERPAQPVVLSRTPAPAQADAPAQAAAAPRRILLVEDEEHVRAQIAEIMRDLGWSVVEAGDGEAGLAAAQAHTFDLMVTDVGLPGLNGRQLAEAARQRHPNLPVLFITGYAGTALDSLRLPDRMSVLRKPFSLDEFLATARAMLEGGAAPRVAGGLT